MDAERLPVGAYVASALVAANYGGDSGEDVDRFLNHLEARGYAVVPLDAERKADASCPACGGEAGHDWWSVGDDSYACDRAALPIYALVSEMETEGWDQATLAEIAARCTRGLRFAAPAVTEPDCCTMCGVPYDGSPLVLDHHAAGPHWHDPDGVTLHYRLSPGAAQREDRTELEAAAEALIRKIDWFLDRNIYRAYPFEDEARTLHAALAAPTVTETDPIDALDAATPGRSWETTMDAELRAEALYSSTVTHGVHRHPMDGRSCREYVVGECAFAAPAVTETGDLPDHGRCCECFDGPNMAAGHEHWGDEV